MEIRKLNTLRGLAALIVVVSHYCNATDSFAVLFGQGAGQYGVMLFFLLSGFLMALLYLDKACTWEAAKGFLVARFARVVPLYAFVVLGSFTLLSMQVGDGIVYDIHSGQDVFAHVFMLSGKSVLWSIPPEIQFYVIFVLFWKIYSVQRHYLWIVLGALFAGGVLIDFYAPNYSPLDVEVHTRLISALPFFMVGVVLGNIYRRVGESPIKSSWFALLLLALPLLYPGVASLLFGRSWRLWQDLEPLVLVALIFAGSVFLVPSGNRLLENAFGDFLGKISFSFYLLHMPVLNMLEPYAKAAPLIVFPIFLGVVMLASELSFRVIEDPSRWFLRQRFRTPSRLEGAEPSVG